MRPSCQRRTAKDFQRAARSAAPRALRISVFADCQVLIATHACNRLHRPRWTLPIILGMVVHGQPFHKATASCLHLCRKATDLTLRAQDRTATHNLTTSALFLLKQFNLLPEKESPLMRRLSVHLNPEPLVANLNTTKSLKIKQLTG